MNPNDVKIVKKSKLWKLVPFGKNLVTTMFGTIYVPDRFWPLDRNSPLFAHEMVHIRQQEEQGRSFYVKYVMFKKFRLEMEAEAYAVQVRESKPKSKADMDVLVTRFAKILSSGAYGNISYFDAHRAITKHLSEFREPSQLV